MYFQIGESGKRGRWTVKVSASKLLQCCISRMNYHSERLVFWEKEREVAENVLRTDGTKLKHFPVTGGQRTEAQLDPSLSNRVQECQQRAKSNKDSFERFGAYKALFLIAGSEVLELNADDVLYFNLEGADVGGDGEEED